MNKREYQKLKYAIGCLMNGEPESSDHNPKYGLFEDGMETLCKLKENFEKLKRKK